MNLTILRCSIFQYTCNMGSVNEQRDYELKVVSIEASVYMCVRIHYSLVIVIVILLIRMTVNRVFCCSLDYVAITC